MLEKISWLFVYGLRGGIFALPLMFLSMVFTFINHNLHSTTETGSFAFIINYLSNGLTLFALGFLAVAVVVWLVTWIADYRAGYLPSWVRKELY